MSLLQIILLVLLVGLIYLAIRMSLFERPPAQGAGSEQPLPRKLLILYCFGWAAIFPLIILWAFVIWASFDQTLADFWVGLKMGAINLGLLWTVLFFVIAVASYAARWLRR